MKKLLEWEKLEDIDRESYRKYVSTIIKLNHELDSAKSYFDMLKALKKFYLINSDEILETFRLSKHLWFIDYPTNWSNYLTRIEFQAWCSIRELGRMVMYPQFPVQNYFLDFGNPGLKIGIELDGKDFHDKEKDTKRDGILKKLGWTIYRISGREMSRTNYKILTDIEYDFENFDFETTLNNLSYWMLETGDGVINAIKEIYFEEPLEDEYVDEVYRGLHYEYRKLCKKTLQLHKYS